MTTPSTKHAIRKPTLNEAYGADVPRAVGEAVDDIDAIMSVFRSGPNGSRPATGKVGSWYKDTDGTGALVFDTGSAYEEVVRTTDARMSDQRTPLNQSVTAAKAAPGQFINVVAAINLSTFLLNANQQSTIGAGSFTAQGGTLFMMATVDGKVGSGALGGVALFASITGLATVFLHNANLPAGFSGPLSRVVSVAIPAGAKSISIGTSLANNLTTWSSQAGGTLLIFERY